jgi:hypothetical protein
MPKSEIIKVTQRNGIMLSCGWLPPTSWTAVAAIFVSGGDWVYIDTADGFAQTLFAGVPLFPGEELANGMCECAGS